MSGSASPGGLSDLTRPLLQAKNGVLQSWAQASQARLAGSLAQGQAVGGAALAPNEPKYARRKGGRPVGVKTGAMLQGMLAAGLTGWNASAEPGTAEVLAAEGPNIPKLNIFVKGQGSRMGWVSERLPSGKIKKYQRAKGQPARDFVGVDERDVDAAGETAMAAVLDAWGFR